ncbi:MAG: nucleotidyltransferase domain-containing protein [Planctomycetes bacterium]|nr:nucleotidyltransferase domain-containing protein [Planctomycetota bacterium]
MNAALRVVIDSEKLREFCRKWSIAELAVFGSVLRDDFGPASDVDFLATFVPESSNSLLRRQEMQDELAKIVGRRVDLVSRRGIEMSKNPLRRREILSTAETVYVA